MGWNPKDEDWLENDEVYFSRGSREELDRLLRLALLTEDWATITEAAAIRKSLWIGCGFRKKAEILARSHYSCYTSERIMRLCALILERHQPVGFRVATNDESKYWKEEATLCYPLDAIVTASPRERMNARSELAQWLADLGVDSGDFGLPVVAPTLVPLATLPLFGHVEAETETITLPALGRYAIVPFELINRFDFAQQLEQPIEIPARSKYDEARKCSNLMSFTDAYIDRTVPIWTAFCEAATKHGVTFALQIRRGSPDFPSLAPYRASIAVRPLVPGDAVRIIGDRTSYLVKGPSGLCFAGYSNKKHILGLITDRLAPEDAPSWMRARIEEMLARPSTQGQVETLTIYCAGSERPDEDLLAYLERKGAKAVDPSTIERYTSYTSTEMTWAYEFSGTHAVYRRFSAMAFPGWKRLSKNPNCRYFKNIRTCGTRVSA